MKLLALNSSLGFFAVLRTGLQLASVPRIVPGSVALLLTEASRLITPEFSLQANIAQTKGPTPASPPPHTLSLAFLPPCARACGQVRTESTLPHLREHSALFSPVSEKWSDAHCLLSGQLQRDWTQRAYHAARVVERTQRGSGHLNCSPSSASNSVTSAKSLEFSVLPFPHLSRVQPSVALLRASTDILGSR